MRVCVALVLLLLVPAGVRAEFFDLAPPGKSPAIGVGGGFTGFVFQVDGPVEIASVGVRADLLSFFLSLQAELWAVPPGSLSRTDQLAVSPVITVFDSAPGLGQEFYDVPFRLSLAPGRYELSVQPPGPLAWGMGGFIAGVELYFYDGFSGADLPYRVGPFLVLDGTGGLTAGDPSDTLLTHFRVETTIPEPSTWALLALGALGLVAYRCRHKQKPAAAGP